MSRGYFARGVIVRWVFVRGYMSGGYLSGGYLSWYPGLAKLGVKPRLCRSSWRAFASAHPLMLPSTSPRKALLAFPPFPSRNLSSFIVESTISSSCSWFDPLSLAKVWLLITLTLFPLMIWYSGQTALLLFLLAKAALAYLPTVLFVIPRPLLPFQ